MYSLDKKPFTGEKQLFIDKYQDRLLEVVDDIAYRKDKRSLKRLGIIIDVEIQQYITTMSIPRNQQQKRMICKQITRHSENITYIRSLEYINRGLSKFLKWFTYMMNRTPILCLATYNRLKKKYPYKKYGLLRCCKVILPKTPYASVSSAFA